MLHLFNLHSMFRETATGFMHIEIYRSHYGNQRRRGVNISVRFFGQVLELKSVWGQSC